MILKDIKFPILEKILGCSSKRLAIPLGLIESPSRIFTGLVRFYPNASTFKQTSYEKKSKKILNCRLELHFRLSK